MKYLELSDILDELFMSECLTDAGCPDNDSLEDILDTKKTEEINLFELTEEEFKDMLKSCGLNDIPDGYMLVNGELVPPIQEPDDESGDEPSY